MRHVSRALVGALCCFTIAACGDDTSSVGPDANDSLANTLFVARDGTLASFNLADGEARAGEVSQVTGPVDLQALDDGTIVVSLTGANEVLFVDPHTMLEKARVDSSGMGATRPVHNFVMPVYDGKHYLAVMNDGTGAGDSSAALIDITPGSATYLERVGEVALGVGHHKATFSATMPRMVISNIGDCDNVMSVYDFSDPSDITTVATMTGDDAGFDHADPGAGNFDPQFCDPTYARGLPPAPHGCGTSPLSNKAYCSITSSGDMVVVDLEEDAPTFTRLPTNGSGGGYSHLHPGGRYVYTVQSTPREGAGGVNCQIGQVAVTDSMTDTVVSQLPLLYAGASCTDVLTGTDAETDEPGYYRFAKDGSALFIGIGGGFEVADARARYTAVIDTSDPADPVQLASIPVATTTSHASLTRDGTGDHIYVVGAIDGEVTEIDVATREATRNIDVGDMPLTDGTFGDVEGPSEQVGLVSEE